MVFITQSEHIVTDSLLVAKYFGKEHRHVLEKLRNLDCSRDFNESNFWLVHYRDAKGEARPLYQMNEHGFMFLVMGFTGKKAAMVKEAYINAFNEMKALLEKQQKENSLTVPDFSYQEILLAVKNGQVTESHMLSNNEIIVDRDNLDFYIRDPEIFSIEQLIKAHHAFSARLENFMKAKINR
ncbi:Rha family transcriptional regulator [Vibrio parahaemolyticus]|nr:Rha family transcriptional regulator [Vibrio parahaemolyticus]